MKTDMTLPSIARSLQHKLKNSAQTPDYPKVIQLVSKIHQRAYPSRKAKARLNLFFIVIILSISIAVALTVS
jgi:hypothetical protein